MKSQIKGNSAELLGFVKRNVKNRNEAVKELAYKTFKGDDQKLIDSVSEDR